MSWRIAGSKPHIDTIRSAKLKENSNLPACPSVDEINPGVQILVGQIPDKEKGSLDRGLLVVLMAWIPKSPNPWRLNNPIKFVIELTKTLSKHAVLLACQIENWVYVSVLVLRHLFPCGLIKPHKIGVIGDVIDDQRGDKTLRPFAPWASGICNHQQVSINAVQELSRLVKLNWIFHVACQSKTEDPQSQPHPLAEHLEKLLEGVSFSDPAQDDEKLWANDIAVNWHRCFSSN